VVNYFKQHKLLDAAPNSKRSLITFQNGFNQLAAESGQSLQHISQLIALSTGDNFRL
jgi:hypothetical protein